MCQMHALHKLWIISIYYDILHISFYQEDIVPIYR